MSKEFVVWGVPPNKTEEEILYTKAPTMNEAVAAMEILIERYSCVNCRIQVIDFCTPVWSNERELVLA